MNRALEARAGEDGGKRADGLLRCAVDPYCNALHRALLRGRRSLRSDIRAARDQALASVLQAAPSHADARARRIVLNDPDLVDELHRRVWETADPGLATRWLRVDG